MTKEKIQAMFNDYRNQFIKLTSLKKRFREFKHEERVARLEGILFVLGLIASQWDDDNNQNTIEQ